MDEIYEYGEAVAVVYLMHVGDRLDGVAMKYDITEDEEENIVYESVEGTVFGSVVRLDSITVQFVAGTADSWYLDHWYGTLTTDGRIVGVSTDDAGTTGSFVMTKVA